MVSIYMPTWNRKDGYARHQSVLEQTYPFWELIIVDDNSPENSQLQAFINATADPRIHYIITISNQVLGVRNQAIEQAKGKYIAGIDDDDEWLPNRLTTFMKYHYLQAGFSFFMPMILSAKGNRIRVLMTFASI
jgi:glycosyltransferase involved in cell wall biosynthesis